MDHPELEKAARIEADAEARAVGAEPRVKVWLKANRDEAIAIFCIALAVGLIVGAIIGRVLR